MNIVADCAFPLFHVCDLVVFFNMLVGGIKSGQLTTVTPYPQIKLSLSSSLHAYLEGIY